jgi:hypothetical protein
MLLDKSDPNTAKEAHKVTAKITIKMYNDFNFFINLSSFHNFKKVKHKYFKAIKPKFDCFKIPKKNF